MLLFYRVGDFFVCFVVFVGFFCLFLWVFFNCKIYPSFPSWFHTSCPQFILLGVCCICLLKFASYSVDHHLSLMNEYSGFFCLVIKITLHRFPFKLLTVWRKLVLMVAMSTPVSSPLTLSFHNKKTQPFFIHFQFNNQLTQPVQLYPSLIAKQFLYCDPTVGMFCFVLVLSFC